MKTRFTALLNVLALFCALGFVAAHAQIPRTINYQGYLTTPSGSAVNGNVTMTLKLYDAATAGNELYTETHSSVTVANGIFNVQIGSVTPIGLNFTAPYFLGVTIGTDPEMTPRRPLTAAPYALTAENIAPGGNLYLSGSTATLGNVFKNGNRFMHNYGVLNTFLGEKAGNFTLTSQQNTAVGQEALSAVTTGGANTAIGFSAAAAVTAGEGNTAIGNDALRVSLSGQNNTAVGGSALYNATSNENIGLGAGAGFNLTTGGGNIMIGNQGVAGESDTIRLGNSSHTRTFLSGNVGFRLGAGQTPDRPVTIQASGVEWIGLRDSAGANKWHVNHKNGGVNFAETGLVDGRLFLAAGGNVGIGTDAPTKAKLEINGSALTALGAAYRVNSAGGLAVAAGGVNLSLYADSAIAAGEFRAFSDQRMKRVLGRSNATRDLATLAVIEVTDYTHIDTPQRGDKAHKKVIAQQVEKVFPQAVNKITDVVPDIYQPATVKDGWIVLEDLAKANLKKGDRVRLIGKATQGVHEVLEVADGRFRTAFKPDSDTIFVYGREVNDFRTVDYEAISMLNVSATQELHRRVERQAAEIAQLKQQLAQLSDLNAKVAWLMAQKAPAKP
jgi:hypothetical protein